MHERPARGLPLEALAVWALFALVAVEILVTYSRLPARELYHVTGSGLDGGASRALVFLNFPTALVAIALLALVFDLLESRSLRVLAVVAAVLSLVVVWPGVVDQANLDAKPVNAVPALGVLLALALTAIVARRGVTRRARRLSDWLRVVVAVGLVFAALPWFAADLGFFLPGSLFQTTHAAHQLPGDPPTLPAVHHGHHHGMDGLLLALTALLLSRRLEVVRIRALRLGLSAYLALMFCYGVANMANDFWGEQVLKRGWTSWQIPNVLTPHVGKTWGLIVLAAALVWAAAALFRPSGRRVTI
jgi:hypothetical protein